MLKWLKFFRLVNLPTVPGDVLVGAASAMTAAHLLGVPLVEGTMQRVGWAVLASCGLYLWGMADNDIVGAKTDTDRPLATGELSMVAARLARLICLLIAIAAVWAGELPIELSVTAGILLAAIVIYNRTKLAVVMGGCRGLNVMIGLATVVGAAPWSSNGGLLHALLAVALPPLVWTAYIGFVTWLSTGEETNPQKKHMIGVLIGGLIYLQLTALLVFAVICPPTNRLLIIGAILLMVLRLVKRLLPKVSAS